MDELSGIFGVAKELLLSYWTLLVMSLLLGVIGNFAKTYVWTKERAAIGKPKWLWWYGRASLPMHAPAAGFLIGAVLSLIFGKDVPTGPGVKTIGEVCMYYMASGVLSVWVYNLFKNFMKTRGIEVNPVDMPQ